MKALKNLKDDQFTVERHSTAGKEILKLSDALPERQLEVKDIPGGAIIITCKYEGEYVGLLIAKSRSVNKRSFVTIEEFGVIESFKKKPSCLLSLLAELYRACEKKNAEGVFYDFVNVKNTLMVSTLTDNKFKEIGKLFIAPVSDFAKKRDQEEMSAVEFSSSNKAKYADRLAVLITEHDEHHAKLSNKATGMDVMDTKLAGEKQHDIKMRFFADSMATNAQWNVALLLVKEEVVGYAKTKIVKDLDHSDVDVYLVDSYREKYFDVALYELTELVRKNVKFLTAKILTTDKEGMSTFEKYFGKAEATTFFFKMK